MPLAGTAHAASPPTDTTPVGVVDPRDVYYPGSEALTPDEMEVVGPIFDEVNEKYGTKVEPTWK
jgi:hypothetical protein